MLCVKAVVLETTAFTIITVYVLEQLHFNFKSYAHYYFLAQYLQILFYRLFS
jgi:hypothetical protein